MDNLFEQIVNISKASAYDIMIEKCKEQEIRIATLDSQIEQLKIRLNGAEQRIKAYQGLINEVRPENVEIFQLGETDKEIEQEMKDYDDLKDINI